MKDYNVYICNGDKILSHPLLHSVEPALDDESRVFIVEACASIILALAMTEIELPLTTCAITSITKLAEPVMTRSHVSSSSVR
jgi:hypothetical protein